MVVCSLMKFASDRQARSLVAIIFTTFLNSSIAIADTRSAVNTAQESAELSTVRIVAIFQDKKGAISGGSGSGFVVSNGYVLTNSHVIFNGNATKEVILVIPDQRIGSGKLKAELVNRSADYDLAILRVDGLDAAPIKLSRSGPVKGGEVRALGYPGVTDRMRNLSGTEMLSPSEPYVTVGNVALLSTATINGVRLPVIFHTAATNHGNSGGPLINECGAVVGISTWSASTTVQHGEIQTPEGQFMAGSVISLVNFLNNSGVNFQYSDSCRQNDENIVGHQRNNINDRYSKYYLSAYTELANRLQQPPAINVPSDLNDFLSGSIILQQGIGKSGQFGWYQNRIETAYKNNNFIELVRSVKLSQYESDVQRYFLAYSAYKMGLYILARKYLDQAIFDSADVGGIFSLHRHLACSASGACFGINLAVQEKTLSGLIDFEISTRNAVIESAKNIDTRSFDAFIECASDAIQSSDDGNVGVVSIESIVSAQCGIKLDAARALIEQKWPEDLRRAYTPILQPYNRRALEEMMLTRRVANK